MSFIQDQVKHEASSVKRIWKWFLYLCVIMWGIWGITLIVGVGVGSKIIGLIFIAGAGYLFYRIKKRLHKLSTTDNVSVHTARYN